MPGLVIAVLCLAILVALTMAYDRRHRGHPTHEDEVRAREVRAHNDANFGGTAGGGM